MPRDSRRIQIRNQSGCAASYFLFAYPALVKPALQQRQIKTSVFTSFREVPGTDGLAALEIPSQLTALCGTMCSYEGKVMHEVLDKRPVELGQARPDGVVEPGSFLSMGTKTLQPFFHADHALQPTAQAGAFALRTAPDFDFLEAQSEEMIVGVCGPWQGARQARFFGHYATFTPMPSVRYEIQPKWVFGLAIGDLEVRDHLDPTLYDVCRIDFDELARRDVEVVHTDRNQLKIQSV